MNKNILRIAILVLIIPLLFFSCEKNSNDNNGNEDAQNIIILYTNDEHGWIEKSDYTNGAANMVADSWLNQYPTADIAMTNAGGIRQSIPAGDISKETIIGVLPFQNYIIELQLTGSELINCSGYNIIIVGGMTTVGGYFLSDGTEIDNGTTYSVLTTDYLYARNDY
jgi:2',3'-cyclic-nucleotide 2'-phosphodiesterase (5'-nucleotidase family)